MAILLPADRPQEIILATNFGLVISHDDGQSWYWVCEQAISPYASLYQVGPAPADTLYAEAPAGVFSSHDDG
jgi:hypothetical protein